MIDEKCAVCKNLEGMTKGWRWLPFFREFEPAHLEK